MQKKTKNFLWGVFLVTKKSLALVPGTSNQAAQRFDAGDVVDNTAKVCILPSPLCFQSQKPFNYCRFILARKHHIHLQVLVLDSDVVCFAFFVFSFALVKSASVQEGESLIDASYLKKIGNY